uniref:Tetratricopeptide repeat/PDZ domain n=1 Tax=Candidatus Kentrum eta TaxID=2126337 RepID=A0A450UPJ3_9GAMM|nr:MAG: Tetratricopeptide repeat/PDZ domain [Candidatus Kentron sp. H]VFJ95274.1 MAG: Tetratricopeptide repeat/PDZ domain [Candidatus Kentron sp. H]VFK01685.1 MAG: Tetratricopeptide repeat/PDZ domain [Candidatus Kentron sp. H]
MNWYRPMRIKSKEKRNPVNSEIRLARATIIAAIIGSISLIMANSFAVFFESNTNGTVTDKPAVQPSSESKFLRENDEWNEQQSPSVTIHQENVQNSPIINKLVGDIIVNDEKPKEDLASVIRYLSQIVKQQGIEKKQLDQARGEFLKDTPLPERRSLADIGAVANILFNGRNYTESANLYKLLSERSTSSENRRYFEGMVTASYFGSGNHIDGIQYLCKLYQNLPRSNHRFRHAMHAHLRIIALREGFDTALEIIDTIRRDKRCDRKDLSPVWLGIPLGTMRLLKRSITCVGAPYSYCNLRKEDKIFLRDLTRNKNVPFLDYALYTLGEYGDALEQFGERSYISDMLLVANAEEKEGSEEAIYFLNRYLAKYPNGNRRDYALKLLVAEYAEKGEFDEAIEIAKSNPSLFFDKEESIDTNFPVRFFFREKAKIIKQLFENGQFEALSSKLIEMEWLLQSFYGEKDVIETDVPLMRWGASNGYARTVSRRRLRRFIKYVNELAHYKDEEYYKELFNEAGFLNECGSARDEKHKRIAAHRSKIKDEECESHVSVLPSRVSFHVAAANVYDLLAHSASSLTLRQKSKYLEAMIYKRMGDFDSFKEALEKFERTFPKSHLLDDVLTELGWFYFVIRKDVKTAERYFMRVANEFQGRNAEDNAVNWLAILKLHSGEIKGFLNWSLKLGKIITSERIQGKIEGRVIDLSLYAEAIESGKWKGSVDLLTTWDSIWAGIWAKDYTRSSVEITSVTANSMASRKGLKEGMHILGINGKGINTVIEFLVELSKYKLGEPVLIEVIDGWERKRVSFLLGDI